MNVGKQSPWTVSEIFVVTREISFISGELWKLSIFINYREQKRLSVQDVQGSRSLSEENDNDDEHDPEYDWMMILRQNPQITVTVKIFWHFLEEHRPEVGGWL